VCGRAAPSGVRQPGQAPRLVTRPWLANSGATSPGRRGPEGWRPGRSSIPAGRSNRWASECESTSSRSAVGGRCRVEAGGRRGGRKPGVGPSNDATLPRERATKPAGSIHGDGFRSDLGGRGYSVPTSPPQGWLGSSGSVRGAVGVWLGSSGSVRGAVGVLNKREALKPLRCKAPCQLKPRIDHGTSFCWFLSSAARIGLR
jgi:hypothetical protein